MSLINTVLQDLEKRQASEVRSSLHREVRPLPRPPRRRVGVWLGLLLLPPALLAIHAYGPGVPAPRVAATPVSSSSAGAAQTSIPLPAAPVAAAPALSGETEIALRLSPLLDALPVIAAPELQASAPVAPPTAFQEASPVPSTAGSPLPAMPSTRPVATAPLPRGPAPIQASTPAPAPAAAVEGRTVAADAGVSPSVRVEKRPVEGTTAAREPFEEEHQRALSRWRAGAATEAGGLLAELLRRQPGLVQARQSLARLLIEQQRPEDAMRVLADGLREHPRQAPWALALARLQAERGEVAAALHTLEALRDHAETPEYLGFHAHLLHRQGRFREAAERFQRAARGAPHEGRWWVGLGFALEADARPEAALDAFRRARATGNLDAGLAAVVDQKLK